LDEVWVLLKVGEAVKFKRVFLQGCQSLMEFFYSALHGFGQANFADGD